MPGKFNIAINVFLSIYALLVLFKPFWVPSCGVVAFGILLRRIVDGSTTKFWKWYAAFWDLPGGMMRLGLHGTFVLVVSLGISSGCTGGTLLRASILIFIDGRDMLRDVLNHLGSTGLYIGGTTAGGGSG